MGTLVTWNLWRDRNGHADVARQIQNNLNNGRVAEAAGDKPQGAVDTVAWIPV